MKRPHTWLVLACLHWQLLRRQTELGRTGVFELASAHLACGEHRYGEGAAHPARSSSAATLKWCCAPGPLDGPSPASAVTFRLCNSDVLVSLPTRGSAVSKGTHFKVSLNKRRPLFSPAGRQKPAPKGRVGRSGVLGAQGRMQPPCEQEPPAVPAAEPAAAAARGFDRHDCQSQLSGRGRYNYIREHLHFIKSPRGADSRPARRFQAALSPSPPPSPCTAAGGATAPGAAGPAPPPAAPLRGRARPLAAPSPPPPGGCTCPLGGLG